MYTLFKLKGRRSQASYAKWMAIAFAISFVLGMILAAMGRTSAVLLLLIPAVPVAILSITVTAQRLRDYGLTGWYALLWIPLGFIPDVWLQMAASVAFAVIVGLPKGHAGSNAFGQDPRDYPDGYGGP